MNNETKLDQLIGEFVQAPTWPDSRRIVEQHPELLEEQIDSVLASLVTAIDRQGEHAGAEVVERHRYLLERCRQVGVEAAFTELEAASLEDGMAEALHDAEALFEFVHADLSESRRLMEENPHLISDKTLVALEKLFPVVQRMGQSELAELIDGKRRLLRRIRQVGLRAAFQEVARYTAGLDAQAKPPLDPATAAATPIEVLLDMAAGADVRARSRPADIDLAQAASTAWQRVLDHPGLPYAATETRLGTLHSSGVAFHRSYLLTGDLTLLERNIRVWSQAADLEEPDSEFLFGLLGHVGSLSMEAYQRTMQHGHLDAAIGFFRRAAATPPPDATQLAATQNNLGNALLTLYQASENTDDLTAAIGAFRHAADAAPESSRQRPGYWANVGVALSDRYEATGDPADLDKSIDAHRQAAALVDDGSPHFVGIMGNLADALLRRYNVHYAPGDLDDSIDTRERALNALEGRLSDVGIAGMPGTTPYAPPSLIAVRAKLLNNLGLSLLSRYQDRGDTTDLHRAVTACQEAVWGAPHGMAESADFYAALATVTELLYDSSGDPADLDRTVRAYQQALDATLPGSEKLPGLLRNFGSTLLRRAERTSNIADIDTAVDVCRWAVDAGPGAAELPECLGALSIALRTRYERTHQSEDIDAAIDKSQQAAAAAEDSVQRARSRQSLARAFTARYDRVGEVADLDQAIHAGREAVTCYEKPVSRALSGAYAGRPGEETTRSGLSGALSNLGEDLARRFARLGVSIDLDEAIEANQRAVTLAEGSADLDGYLTNWSMRLTDRYMQAGQLVDLHTAIEAAERAVGLARDKPAVLPLHLAHLGNTLLMRHERSHARGDLDRAVQACETAAAAVAQDSPHRRAVLGALGSALARRYDIDGNLSDLDAAISAKQRMVDTISAGYPELPAGLSALSAMRADRYGNSGDLADLDQAIAGFRQAILATSKESPWYPMYLFNLARSLTRRFERTNHDRDQRHAINAYRQSCDLSINAASALALQAGALWGQWATERQEWQEASEAFEYALSAAERLVKTQLTREDKETWLRTVPRLPGMAAYTWAAIGAGEKAVTTLERGRAVLLTEALERDRVELQKLPPKLVTRYQQAADRVRGLERASHLTAAPHPPPTTPELRNAQTELDNAITAIQKEEKDFLAPPTHETVARAAHGEPLVYLAMTPAGGCALIARHDRPVDVVLLPKLTNDTLGDKLLEYQDGLMRLMQQRESDGWSFVNRSGERDTYPPFEASPEITGFLWEAAMGPLLAAVGAANSLVLVPSGWLGLLPLHAAWTPDETKPTGRRYALDHLRITYAPNARALQQARRLAEHVDATDLLAVEEPRPVHAKPLPNVEHEIAVACAAFTPASRRIAHEQATLDTVAAELDSAGVLHLACHAFAAQDAPMDSSLVLAGDQMLTLRTLLTSRLRARLAILSACETAQIGTELPDEVVGLPAGLLQAGAASVIASLWATDDTDAMLLMVDFYDRWRNQHMPPAEALRQAQRWLRDSTNDEKWKRFSTGSNGHGNGNWLPKSTAEACAAAVGFKRMEARSFAEPYHWAAFSYVGA